MMLLSVRLNHAYSINRFSSLATLYLIVVYGAHLTTSPTQYFLTGYNREAYTVNNAN